MPELMGEGQNILRVPVGVQEEEGRFIVAQVGLKRHIDLFCADRHVVQPVIAHEIKGLLHLPADLPGHGVHDAQKLLFRQGVIPELIVGRSRHDLFVQRHHIFPDIRHIARGLLRRIVPLKIEIILHLLVAFKAQYLGLAVSHIHQPDENVRKALVVLLIVLHQGLVVFLALQLPQHVQIVFLHTFPLNGWVCGQGPVFGNQGALFLHQFHHQVGVIGAFRIAVLLPESLPEIFLFQLLCYGGGGAGIIQLVKKLLHHGVILPAPVVFGGVILIGQVLAAADIGQGVHGVIAVVAVEAAIQQPSDFQKRYALVQGLLGGGDIRAQSVQIRADIFHVVKADHARTVLGAVKRKAADGFSDSLRRLLCGAAAGKQQYSQQG